MRICQPKIGVGPEIGTTNSDTDSRMCLAKIGVGPVIGESGTVIIYGAAGAITYGAAGKIIY